MKEVKDLFILGTQVHAGELVEIIERVNEDKKQWNLLGFLTADTGRIGEIYNGYPVLGTKDYIEQYPDSMLITDYEWPYKNELPMERLITLIDPSSFVSRTAKIGSGTIIYPNCYIGLNASIGNLVFCLSGCIINHDDVIGDMVTLASGVTIAGEVHVEPHCYLGQSSTIKQKVRIGHHSLIGMGSTVIRDVPPYSVMVGNPAKRLRDNI